MFVAEVDNGIVGFVNFSYVREKGQAELSALYLVPKHQGQGIGTSLLQKGIETLPNVKEIYIDVEAENTNGKVFYETKGFKTVEVYDDYFAGHKLKTVRMVLVL